MMNESNLMDTAQVLWQRIESWLSRHAPHAWHMLREGASEGEIQQAEVVMRITLPEDCRASCRIHNGGYALDLVTEMQILPLEEIVSLWQVLKDCLDQGSWDDLTPDHFLQDRSRWQTLPLQLVWWHPQWIPCGSDRAGNCCCLDLAPAPEGSVGQVIDWDHEVGPSRVLASSFMELLTTFANDLEAGEYVETADGLTRRSQP
jgi:cell wall assembly regulator SMI1